MGRELNETAGGKIVNIILKLSKNYLNGIECILMRAKVWVVLVEKYRFYYENKKNGFFFAKNVAII
jgi:hypothetical protein